MLEPMVSYTPSPDRYERMRYNRSGASGLKLPAISIGCWHNFGDITPFAQMRDVLFAAFDHGITHFDLANNYGPEPGAAERNVGTLLHRYFAAHRDELIVSTKAGYEMWQGPYGDHGSRKYLLASLDQSLERLGLDYVDIFYHHRPDPETPLEETCGALAQAVTSGKAPYVGLSNYDGPQLEQAAALLDEMHVPFVVNQNRYNIFDRTIERNGLLAATEAVHRGLIVFRPLAQGLLTDRYLDGIPADSRAAHDPRFLHPEDVERAHTAIVELNAIAHDRGQSLAEMAIAWLLAHDAVTSVLIGASRPSQIADNVRALENTAFTDSELAAIDAVAADLR